MEFFLSLSAELLPLLSSVSMKKCRISACKLSLLVHLFIVLRTFEGFLFHIKELDGICDHIKEQLTITQCRDSITLHACPRLWSMPWHKRSIIKWQVPIRRLYMIHVRLLSKSAFPLEAEENELLVVRDSCPICQMYAIFFISFYPPPKHAGREPKQLFLWQFICQSC